MTAVINDTQANRSFPAAEDSEDEVVVSRALGSSSPGQTAAATTSFTTPAKSPFIKNLFQDASTTLSPSRLPTPAASHAFQIAWLQEFTLKHFGCHVCRLPVDDPVLLDNGSVIACRNCAAQRPLRTGEKSYEPCPTFVVNLLRDLRIGLSAAANANPALRAANSGLSTAAPAPTDAKAPAPKKFTKVRSGPPATSAAATSTDGKVTSLHPNLDHSSAKRRGLNAEPPDEDEAATTTVTSQTTSHSHNSGSQVLPADNAAAPISSEANSRDPAQETREKQENDRTERAVAALGAMEEHEGVGRRHVVEDASLSFVDIQRQYAQQIRTLKLQMKDSSKTLKCRGDELYEQTDYVGAIELYTKAIQRNDGSTKLTVLHGNRSAAYFMLGRHQECIDDCTVVTKDDPANAKMFHRAVKSALFLADLMQAKNILDQIEKRVLNDALQKEQERVRHGLEILQRAEAAGATASDAEEAYKMLMTDFSDATSFRVKYAECLAKADKYERAIEVLQRIPASGRTRDINRTIAQNYYRSGFEFFDRARAALEQGCREGDARSAQLLDTINRVDDGKQKGNTHFSNREFAKSIDAYTQAIEADQSNGRILRILYCNRAAACKELGRFREGVEDCGKAIAYDPTFSKAYARRARCLMHLSDFAAAIRDFKEAVKHDASDHELIRELRVAEQQLAKEWEREKDYYHQLQLQRSATDRDVKMKYRELSLKWHPDKCIHLQDGEREYAERKFKAINEAYSTLSDAAKRREYDAKLDRERFTSHRASAATGFSSYFDEHATGRRYASGTQRDYAGGTKPGSGTYEKRGAFW